MDLDEYNAIVENTVPRTDNNQLGMVLTLQMASIQSDMDPINVCVVGSSDSAVEDIVEYVQGLHSDISFIRQGEVEKSDLSTSDLLVQYIDRSVTRQQFMDLYDFDVEPPDTGLLPNDKAIFTVASSIYGEFDELEGVADQNPIDEAVWPNYDFVIYVEPSVSGEEVDSSVSIEEVNVESPDTRNTEAIYEQLEGMIDDEKLHHEYLESDIRDLCSLLDITRHNMSEEMHVEQVYGLMREQYISFDPNQFDADILETGQSEIQRDRVKSIVNAIESLNGNPKEEYTTEEEVIEYLVERGFDESEIEEEIHKMKIGQRIYSPDVSKGYIATV